MLISGKAATNPWAALMRPSSLTRGASWSTSCRTNAASRYRRTTSFAWADMAFPSNPVRRGCSAVYSDADHLTWRIRVVGGPTDPDHRPYTTRSLALRKHG